MTSHSFHLLRTGLGAPSWNMALDEALLEHISALAAPILRLYGWNIPAATFGYSQRYAEVSSWTTLRPLIRRPTGGGLVPHDADWTYSVIVPPSDPWYKLRAEESYRRVHDWITSAFRRLEVEATLSDCCDKPAPGQCFVGAEKFDVLAGGKKIAGAAQKRNKLGLLIQGSVQPPTATTSRVKWEQAVLDTGAQNLGITWHNLQLSEPILARARELDATKYNTPDYNQRR